jgi:hypothetical protein
MLPNCFAQCQPKESPPLGSTLTLEQLGGSAYQRHHFDGFGRRSIWGGLYFSCP